MAKIPHPQYPGLKIVVDEKAKAGAWYVPHWGQSLSQIANQAYGSGTLSKVLKINKSTWNRGHLVYRASSGSCGSQVVSSSLAVTQSSFANGSWIAICQNDTPSWAIAMGFDYPPIWIPGVNGEEPEYLMDTVGEPPSPPPEYDDRYISAPSEPEFQGPVKTLPDQPTAAPSGGFKWYHGVAIGGAVLAVAGIAWAASRKKKRGG